MKNTLTRIPLIDTLRGLAIVMMIIFHFYFNLSSFRITSPDFYKDEFWLAFRMIIMVIIVTLVGVSLALAKVRLTDQHFWRRNLKILICALLVSAGTYLMLPASFIYFGVLHFIFVASVIGSFFNRPALAWFNLALGALLITAGACFKSENFNNPGLNWIGFAATRPQAEDYVPFVPWFGLVLIGLFISYQVLPCLPARVLNFDNFILKWIGQKSLLIYMIHQPLLIAGFIIYIKTR
ncbi:MAG: DUF1624 domain-containing protein [Bdellovibrionaceae bacterium]|nr:DUF1624 domain-containing protein [Bdellovibrio sp.]